MAKIETTCSFCGAEYDMESFLALPKLPKSLLPGETDRTECDGFTLIFRDCDCLPEGRRTTLGVIVEKS